MQTANLGYFLLGFVIYYAAFLLRGLRWQTLLANVGFTRAKNPDMPGLGGLIEIIYLSWFVNCMVPAKLGDAYRSYLLKQNAGVSFSRTIGTILAERMIDLFILFGLLLLSGFLTLQGHLPGMMTGVLALGAAMIVALAVALVAMRVLGRARLARRAAALPRRCSSASSTARCRASAGAACRRWPATRR